ncbi:hypothetical protein OIU76_028848 [Salix suchowensis]|nr:hypothetical protein OIU76_028848 [Salix suchowensis]
MSWQVAQEEDGMSWRLDEEDSEVDIVQTRHDPSMSCNFESGKWVYDQSYPLYDSNCPYLSTAVTCQKNGRPDSDYEKWRWQPHGCSIPRFDALKFLGKMRRKRIMLVGDSIMRNQWESLVCLVQGVIPTGHKKVNYNGPSMAFHALCVNCALATLECSAIPLEPDVVYSRRESSSRYVMMDVLFPCNVRACPLQELIPRLIWPPNSPF